MFGVVDKSVEMALLHVAGLSDSAMTAPDNDQLMITEHTAHADNSSTTSSYTDMSETVSTSVSVSISHYRNSSTTEISTTTVADQQRPASAAVNWSAWQAPVDTHEPHDTVANYDDTHYDYDNKDVEDDEHVRTKTERQFENNASGTEGRPVYV